MERTSQTHTYDGIISDFGYSAVKLVTPFKTVHVTLINYREEGPHSDFGISKPLKSHGKTSPSKISNIVKGDPKRM